MTLEETTTNRVVGYHTTVEDAGRRDTRDLTAPNLETLLRIPGKLIFLPQKEIGETIEGNREEIVKSKMMFVERLDLQ